MFKKLLPAFAVLIMLLFGPGSVPAAVTEREPNDTPQQANPITGGATGLYHRNDQDWFKLTLPAAGKVTATVSEHPSECQMQLTGFRADGNNSLGAGIGMGTAMAGAMASAMKPGSAPAAAPAATAKCAKCGADAPVGSKFCPGCGEKMAAVASHCTECGAEIPAGAKFCPGCGMKAGA